MNESALKNRLFRAEEEPIHSQELTQLITDIHAFQREGLKKGGRHRESRSYTDTIESDHEG